MYAKQVRLRPTRHPLRLDAKHPLIIEELLELAESGQQEAVEAMVTMLEDLHLHGLESRFVRALKGLPLFELKTASRGGAKGGSRVYFFTNTQGEALIVNCEVKVGDKADQQKLKTALAVY